MKKLIAFFIIIIVGLFLMWSKPKIQNNLKSPQTLGVLSTPTPVPTEAPINAPKTYSFDSSTDLKKQWDSINPQILDSDFE